MFKNKVRKEREGRKEEEGERVWRDGEVEEGKTIQTTGKHFGFPPGKVLGSVSSLRGVGGESVYPSPPETQPSRVAVFPGSGPPAELPASAPDSGPKPSPRLRPRYSAKPPASRHAAGQSPALASLTECQI